MHLRAEELVDLAEGTRAENSAPHLATCDRCRRDLDDLRAMMASLASERVPEPSPLFWDHLSERVRVAVAAQDPPRRSWLDAAPWRPLLTPLSAVAVASLLIAVILNSRVMAPQAPALAGVHSSPPAAPTGTDPGDSADLLGDWASGDDVSLTLVGSLTEHLDLDGAGEAGLAPGGSAEHAVTHMSDGDLRELRRVLKEELVRPGP
jgi:anti-sigma factor RsiW